MNDNINIIDVDESEFNDKVIEASAKKLIVVDFWAPWCGPCKQLTPILEKIIGESDKITLVKINIDENQQIAAQLRIQSIPTVYAFKDKQIVNAFQGVLPENQVIEFLEKCMGSKINEDFREFLEEAKNYIAENKFDKAKEILLEFISKNPKELKGINLYLECLIELKQFDEVDSFLSGLEKDLQEKDEIKQIIKKIEIIRNNQSDTTKLDDLIHELSKKPDDIKIILNIADKYFAIKDYENCFDLLLAKYSKNKEKVKNKMVEYFSVLGDTSEYTIKYRKKLSQLIFS